MSISNPKRLLAAFIAILFTVATVHAQAPQLMSFQSVIRNSSGALVTNHSVGLRLSILQGSITGTAVYTETQTATSNANGLVTLQVGGGTVVSGTFSAIDWSAGPYYIKSEIDPTGGTTYGIAGTTQLLSVAYALYANTSGSANSVSNISQGVRLGFASSTTWTCPAGVSKITVELWGAGGGSGSNWTVVYATTTANGFGGNGGNGGYIKTSYSVVPGNNYSIVIGQPGSNGNYIYVEPYYKGLSGNTNGTSGQSSTFDNTIVAQGGGGGTTPTLNPNGYGNGDQKNGIDGTVTNFSYPSPSSELPLPSYVPLSYVQQRQYPTTVATQGQSGYAVISY